MFLTGDPGPEPPGGPASPLWTNRAAARSTSPVSLRPSTDIVWPTGLLTWPPSLPEICRWVKELTFIKGSCMESYWELTVLSSRLTPELRNLSSTHPSVFPTIKKNNEVELYDPLRAHYSKNDSFHFPDYATGLGVICWVVQLITCLKKEVLQNVVVQYKIETLDKKIYLQM